MGSYMPTLADYSKVSWIQSQSLALLYRWPKFLDKRKFGSVAHKKLSSIYSKISQSSGLLCLYFVSGFIFLCDACCSFQTERRKFLVCYSYIGESLIRWVFNQLKSLTDRSTFFQMLLLFINTLYYGRCYLLIVISINHIINWDCKP